MTFIFSTQQTTKKKVIKLLFINYHMSSESAQDAHVEEDTVSQTTKREKTTKTKKRQKKLDAYVKDLALIFHPGQPPNTFKAICTDCKPFVHEFLQHFLATSKKRKSPKDKDAPKKPRNAYMIFMHKNREEIKSQHPELATNRELTRLIGDMWKNMSQEEKEPYLELSKQEKIDYESINQDVASKTEDEPVAKPSESQDVKEEASVPPIKPKKEPAKKGRKPKKETKIDDSKEESKAEEKEQDGEDEVKAPVKKRKKNPSEPKPKKPKKRKPEVEEEDENDNDAPCENPSDQED